LKGLSSLAAAPSAELARSAADASLTMRKEQHMPSDSNLPSWFQGHRSLAQITKAPASELESLAPQRPELNGKLLINPAGTIWQVIDGVARGFVSEELFLRLHYWSRSYTIGDCGNLTHAGLCTHNVQTVSLMEVPNVPAYIEEHAPFDASIRLISNPAGTVCLYESNTKRLVYPAATMDKYQFDWAKVLVLENTVFDAIPTGTPLPA
jgi:hypothetical protein